MIGPKLCISYTWRNLCGQLRNGHMYCFSYLEALEKARHFNFTLQYVNSTIACKWRM